MVTKQIERVEADRDWGRIADDVMKTDAHYLVERDGEPVMAVVPMYVYEQWKQTRDEFFAGIEEMATRANLTPDEADALAEEAVQAIRRGRG